MKFFLIALLTTFSSLSFAKVQEIKVPLPTEHFITVQNQSDKEVERYRIHSVTPPKQFGITVFNKSTLWLYLDDNSPAEFAILDFDSAWSANKNLKGALTIWEQLLTSDTSLSLVVKEKNLGIEKNSDSSVTLVKNDSGKTSIVPSEEQHINYLISLTDLSIKDGDSTKLTPANDFINSHPLTSSFKHIFVDLKNIPAVNAVFSKD